jgi:hypothetical protein
MPTRRATVVLPVPGGGTEWAEQLSNRCWSQASSLTTSLITVDGLIDGLAVDGDLLQIVCHTRTHARLGAAMLWETSAVQV